MKPNPTRKLNYVLKFYQITLRFCLTLNLLIGVVNINYATDYYFSSSSGDDNNTTAQAQNPSSPWRSLEKLNSISNSLKAGDRILFKKGDVFIGNLKISRGGSSGTPIIYTSYGSGAKPVITAMEKVKTWRSVGNGIYEAGVNLQEGENIQILAIDGGLQEIGRYPNIDEQDEGYLTIEGVNGDLSIRGTSLPVNFAGGEVVIRKNNWIIDRHEIVNSYGNTLNFLTNPNSSYSPQQGYGYFIQNHINTLDKFGEWTYSQSSRKVYVYFGSRRPEDYEIEIARGSNLVDVSKYIGNLNFNNLNFVGSNGNLINFENSNNIKLEDCDFKFAGENAIYGHTTPDIEIRENSIDFSLSGGIFLQFGTPRTLIEDNVISHTMPFQGMSQSSDLRGNAIYVAADANNSIIARNQIRNTGFNGIHFGGNYTVVKNNFIDNFCLFKQDGGGIYTNSDGFTTINNTGREIEGNIITRGVGFTGGSSIDYKLVEGIYIDDNSMGIRISGNTLSDIAGRGIYFHNCRNVEVYDNIFHKIPVQFLASHDVYGNPIRNVRIERNQFSSIYKNEIPFSITSRSDDLNQIGQSNNNYFLDPYRNEILFHGHHVSQGGIGNFSSLQNWRDQLGYEINSISPDFDLQPYEITSADILKSSDFSSGLSAVSGVYNVRSELSSGINGGSWKLSSDANGNGSAFIQIGKISKGDEILVEFDTRSSTPYQTVELILEKTFQQNQEGTLSKFSTSSDIKSVKLLLQSEVNNENESVVFRFPSAVQGFLIDNLKVSRVQTTKNLIDKQIFFEYNYSDKPVEFPLSGKYKNAKGEVFSGSISIPPYRAVLLARVEKGEESINTPPIVEITNPVHNQEFRVGEEISIKAKASSASGTVNRVEFYAGDILLGSSTKQPFQFTIDNVQVGDYSLIAKVIDSQNGMGESEKVNIKIIPAEEQGRPSPNLTPNIVISSPGNNHMVNEGDRITIETKTSDPEGLIDKVEFFANNILLGQTSKSPFNFTVDNAPKGTYDVKAKIYDQQGLSSESPSITINVVPNTSMLSNLKITYPSPNQNFRRGENVVVKTNASEFGPDINRVEFYNGKVLIGSTSEPQYEWIVRNAPTGSHALKAKLINKEGFTIESEVINVTVTDDFTNQVESLGQNQPPLIEITSPLQNQGFIAGQSLVVNTSVWDLEGQIAGVEFYVGDTPIGIVASAPYELRVPNVPAGNYELKAKVFDKGGLSSESSTVKIYVARGGNYRTNSLKLIKPLPDQLFGNKDTIGLAISEFDVDLTYDSIQVLVDGNILGNMESLNFEVKAEELLAGQHLLSIKTYEEGEITDSTSVSIAISEPRLSSIDDKLEYSYSIGPNPTSDLLTIYTDKMYQSEDIRVQIYSMNGVVLDEIETSTNIRKIEVDVSRYSSGVYFISVTGPVFPYQTKRFIKK